MLNVLYVITLLQVIVLVAVEAHPVRHLSPNSIFRQQRVRRQPEGAAVASAPLLLEPATARQIPPSFIPLGADIPLQDNEVDKVVPHQYNIIPPRQSLPPPPPPPLRQAAAAPLPEIAVGEAFIAATTFSPSRTTTEEPFPVADEIVVEPHQRIPSRFQSLSAYPVQFGNPPPSATQQSQVPPQPSPLPSPPLIRPPPTHQSAPYLPVQHQPIAANVHSHPVAPIQSISLPLPLPTDQTHQQHLFQAAAVAHHEPSTATTEPPADFQFEHVSNEVHHHHQHEPIADIIHEHHHHSSEVHVPSEAHSHEHHLMAVAHEEFTEAPIREPISVSAFASVASHSDHGPAPVIDHIDVMATAIPEQHQLPQQPLPTSIPAVHHHPEPAATAAAAPPVHHQPSLPQLPSPSASPPAPVAIPVVHENSAVISPAPVQSQTPTLPTIAIQDDVVVPAHPPPSNSILSALPPSLPSSSAYGSSFSIQPAYPADNYPARGLQQTPPAFRDNNFNSHHSINIIHPTPKRLGFPPVTNMAENWRYDVDWHKMTARSIRFV